MKWSFTVKVVGRGGQHVPVKINEKITIDDAGLVTTTGDLSGQQGQFIADDGVEYFILGIELGNHAHVLMIREREVNGAPYFEGEVHDIMDIWGSTKYSHDNTFHT